ncbi:MAG: hypothetical protein R2813_11275 [Flavobacteriales bacterium]
MEQETLIEVGEGDNKSVVEKLLRNLEKLKIKNRIDDELYNDIESRLVKLDRLVEKALDLDVDTSKDVIESRKELVKRIKEVIKFWTIMVSPKTRKELELVLTQFLDELIRLLNGFSRFHILQLNVAQVDRFFRNKMLADWSVVKFNENFQVLVNKELKQTRPLQFYRDDLHDDLIRYLKKQLRKRSTPHFNYKSELRKKAYDEFELEIWVNSRDAVATHKFLNEITSSFGYIEDVEVEVLSVEIASFREWLMLVFMSPKAKKKALQLTHKALDAAESYGLDRHIVPIEEVKKRTEKLDREMENMMTAEQAKKKHDLDIRLKEQELRSKELDNRERELQIRQREIEFENMLVDRIAAALASANFDIEITMENKLLIKTDKGKLRIGDLTWIQREAGLTSESEAEA